MRENGKDISGRKKHSGVMGISAAPLEIKMSHVVFSMVE